MSESVTVDATSLLPPTSCKFCNGTYEILEEKATKDMLVAHSIPGCTQFLSMSPEDFLGVASKVQA